MKTIQVFEEGDVVRNAYHPNVIRVVKKVDVNDDTMTLYGEDETKWWAFCHWHLVVGDVDGATLTDVKVMECDHFYWGYAWAKLADQYDETLYCPKCGEKLR